jgi:nitrite reductase/ring-hydroxylating ferredoxin subunit/DMSO/TMAO reductase YedYZ heme-binding membrane subunit
MSDRFRFISWTPYKKRYDLVLALCIAAYVAAFMFVGSVIWRGDHGISPEILAIRATATAAILLLHFTLSLGPLARLDRRFLPLLYNRRHLGVSTFLVALVHAILATGYYHGFGRIGPVQSLFTSNVQYRSISAFPFEIFGGFALLILFVMAATSHDFWLKHLTPRVWKSIHMLVYVAWLAVVLHVALGALQSERSILYPALLLAGIVWLGTIHLLAGSREVRSDNAMKALSADWFDAASVDEIVEGRGKAVAIPGRERVAIFRHQGKFSAVTNVCAHQRGPLGEGRIIDGCITCPWHGYTYRPGDGCAPPPFTEKISTYQLRVREGRVWVNINPLPAGTAVEPAAIEEASDAVVRQ